MSVRDLLTDSLETLPFKNLFIKDIHVAGAFYGPTGGTGGNYGNIVTTGITNTGGYTGATGYFDSLVVGGNARLTGPSSDILSIYGASAGYKFGVPSSVTEALAIGTVCNGGSTGGIYLKVTAPYRHVICNFNVTLGVISLCWHSGFVASVAYTGLGIYTITWEAVVTGLPTYDVCLKSTTNLNAVISSDTSTSVVVKVYDNSNAPADPTSVYLTMKRY